MPAGAPPIDCRYGLPGYYARVQAFSPTHLEAPMTEIDPTPLTKRRLAVDGKQMAYHESGEGRSVVFLHGNPTSSYLWRNIIPHVSDRARCIAPDLIGQGDSDKLDDTGPGSYRFVEHRHYLDGLLDQLDLGDDVVLVIHDWGSALGFDWANRHRERIGGIAFMEAIVRPVTWAEWPESAAGIFRGFRSDAGEQMVIDKNLFVEAVLPGSVLRGLTPAEHDEYRRAFVEPRHCRPTLSWPREIPIEGEPADVHQIVSDYAQWLPTADFPKLFINAEPGAILTGPQREFCRSWTNLTEVTVPGSHFIQEDSPHEIGQAIADWLSSLG
ncbi:haloalkane dehalogenase DhaA_1 [Mycobacterium liflandii 128FXT]|uniref:Haloalkane dehalogenase n=2 Tax=Mycobacterium TaxID=1763 RepID=L7V144_MYCL1|nr:haloalkane dehalogenase DhaA_1 [Mycobacterium liflandii 128FXT]